MNGLRTQVLVVGGGIGGVSAALSAARRGLHVVLTEPTDWLGGVLTTQGVPPDEHLWIESFGSTSSYRSFREAIRRYYRANYPLTDDARGSLALNPGSAKVSGLSHEPRVSLAVIEQLLASFRGSGRLTVLLQHEPVEVHTGADPDMIDAVTFRHVGSQESVVVEADWVIDASETGDLLPLAGVEYVSGAESQNSTGEPHAPAVADPLDMQPISVCFAMDHVPGAHLVIDKPASYDHWLTAHAQHWTGSQLSLSAPHPKTLRPQQHSFVPNPDEDHTLVRPDYADQRVGKIDKNLWTYRRIAARQNFAPGVYRSDITLVNWPQIDYWEGPVIEVEPETAAWHVQRARELSLSMLYWLQTEAPRPDGGVGWPGLRLRGDVLGDNPDGLAKAPYIRESRRIIAQHTIVEQEISLEVRGAAGAVHHRDSVGVGMYRIDLHPSTAGTPYIDIGCNPFELPLGALIPVRVRNLLPGAKNIGSTHITNGAYRMPLVEWNVGEVDGHLVGFCAERGVMPADVRNAPALLEEFQGQLNRAGVEMRWPEIIGY